MLLIQNCVSILEGTLIQISFDNITAISPLFHFYHRFMPLANFGKTRIKITTDIQKNILVSHVWKFSTSSSSVIITPCVLLAFCLICYLETLISCLYKLELMGRIYLVLHIVKSDIFEVIGKLREYAIEYRIMQTLYFRKKFIELFTPCST